MRKTNLNRKTTHKTDLKLKTESMKSNAKNQSSKNQGPISPLAMERSRESSYNSRNLVTAKKVTP